MLFFKRIYFTLLGILCFQFCFGQEDSLYYVHPNVIEPSSSNSLMMRNQDTGVNLHKGTPEIKIPLYTINVDGYQIPIYLQYNSSGLKIDDQSGAFGLGWDLVAGGKVARTIKGKRDEKEGYPNGDGEFIMNSRIVTDYDNVSLDSHPVCCGFDIDKQDLQPDLFYYSNPSESGKFILDPAGKALTIPKNNVIISHPLTGSAPDNIKIVDDKGFHFVYADTESGQTFKETHRAYYTRESPVNNYLDFISNPDNNFNYLKNRKNSRDWKDEDQYTSAWNLSTIKNYNREQVAQFTYIEESITEKSFSESVTRALPGGCFDGVPSSSYEDIAYTRTEFTIQLLASIITDVVDIRFNYKEDFRASTKKLLDNIEVIDKSGSTKVKYEFNYNVIQVGINNIIDYRIFLNEVTKNNSDFYSFGYFNEDGFNSKNFRHSPYTDAWGYFKNANFDVTTRLPFTRLTYPDGSIIGGNLVRSEPDFESTKMGSLQFITNALGGKTEYVYQLNDKEGRPYGGLRVKDIIKYGNDGGYISKRSFLYQYDINSGRPEAPSSSGGLSISTGLGYDQSHFYRYVKFYDAALAQAWCHSDRFPGFAEMDVYFLTSQIITNEYDLNQFVSYDEVVELLEGNGRIVRNFTSPTDGDQFEPVMDEQLIIINSSWREMLLNAFAPKGKGMVNPFHKWGLLESEKIYTEQGDLLTEKNTTYATIQTGDPFWAIAFERTYTPLNGWNIEEVSQWTRMKFVPEYFKKQSEHIINYSATSSLGEETYYYYNELGQMSHKTVNDDNRNETSVYDYTYLTDLNWEDLNDDPLTVQVNDELTSLYIMKKKNIINSPIQVVKYLDQRRSLQYAQYMSYNYIFKDESYVSYPDPKQELSYYKIFQKELQSFEYRDLDTDLPPISIQEGGQGPIVAIDSRYSNKTRYYHNLINDKYRLTSIRSKDGIQDNFEYTDKGQLSGKIAGKWDDNSFVVKDDFEGDNYSPFWGPINYSSDAFTGSRSANINAFSESMSIGYTEGQSYHLSFVYKNQSAGAEIRVMGSSLQNHEKTPARNGWTLVNKTIPTSSGGPIAFTMEIDDTLIDNFILMPSTMQAKIVTYDDVYGVSSITNQDGNTKFYEYDNDGRLIRVRNTQGHIIQESGYNTVGY